MPKTVSDSISRFLMVELPIAPTSKCYPCKILGAVLLKLHPLILSSLLPVRVTENCQRLLIYKTSSFYLRVRPESLFRSQFLIYKGALMKCNAPTKPQSKRSQSLKAPSTPHLSQIHHRRLHPATSRQMKHPI